MFRKVKIVIENLIEFCRSLFADEQDPNTWKSEKS